MKRNEESQPLLGRSSKASWGEYLGYGFKKTLYWSALGASWVAESLKPLVFFGLGKAAASPVASSSVLSPDVSSSAAMSLSLSQSVTYDVQAERAIWQAFISPAAFKVFASAELLVALSNVLNPKPGAKFEDQIARLTSVLSPICGGVGAGIMGLGAPGSKWSSSLFFSAFLNNLIADGINLKKAIESKNNVFIAAHIVKALVDTTNAVATIFGLDSWHLGLSGYDAAAQVTLMVGAAANAFGAIPAKAVLDAYKNVPEVKSFVKGSLQHGFCSTFNQHVYAEFHPNAHKARELEAPTSVNIV